MIIFRANAVLMVGATEAENITAGYYFYGCLRVRKIADYLFHVFNELIAIAIFLKSLHAEQVMCPD